jgi:microcystin degradation protein MlrC
MRIALAGFQHETNTFAPLKADYEAFAVAKSFPPLCRGGDMLARIRGKNLTASGAISTLEAAGAEIVPLLWCMATPSAHVTEDAYERITGEILALLASAGPVDGICLELHGAMVAEHLEDGEGEFLRRLRRQLGPGVPIAVGLDLHSNVTQAMIDNADYLDMYRYYPHIDMADTGRRAAEGLLSILRTGRRPAKALRQLDFLIPINGGTTEFGPARQLYLEYLPSLLRESEGIVGASLAMGFPLADIADVGPSVMTFASSQAVADAAADKLARKVASCEPDFMPAFLDAPLAVAKAMEIAANASKPVVIADTQDNPGGGGPGDTTGLLREMMRAGARGAAIGAIIDAEMADAAHSVGEGKSALFAIGGKNFPGDEPIVARCRVLRARSDGWTAQGAMKAGMPVDLGRTALIETEEGGVLVVLASRSAQTIDSSIFRHLGLVPEKLPIIAVKSSVHFRADFAPMAEAILVARAPGPVNIDHHQLSFRRVRPGVRLMPRVA